MDKLSGGHKPWLTWRETVWQALIAGVLVSTGCSKKPALQPAPMTAPSAATAGQPNLDSALGQLTLGLRKYSFEKHRVPASFNEFQAATHLGAVPAAPAGKKFAIDPKTVQVVLVNQ